MSQYLRRQNMSQEAKRFNTPYCILLVVSNKICFSKKVFEDFEETKYMSFLIKNVKLLEKSNEIGEKVSNSIKKEYHSEPVYNEK